MSSLYHYGIKGMKWGVRRTPEQLGHRKNNKSKPSYPNKMVDYSQETKDKNYHKSSDTKIKSVKISTMSSPKKINSMERKELIDILKTADDFSISKDQKLYRATNEPGDEKRRVYVSGRSVDRDMYVGNMDAIGGTYDKDVYSKEYSLKKDLRVAGLRTQAQELYNIFKDPNLKNIKNEKDFVSYYYNTEDRPFINFDILNKKTEERDKMIKSLQSKGFDAAVDMVDVVIAYSDCPLVILDSEASLGRPIVEKVFDGLKKK